MSDIAARLGCNIPVSLFELDIALSSAGASGIMHRAKSHKNMPSNGLFIVKKWLYFGFFLLIESNFLVKISVNSKNLLI